MSALRGDRAEIAPLKGIVFDCDGVMIDSRAANAEFYNRILRYFGLPPLTPEQEAYTYMATARQAMEYITPPELHGQLDYVCAHVVVYQRDIFPMLTLMPQFREFADAMLREGLRLGVNTNRVGGGMGRILRRFDLEALFDPVVTADQAAPKPSPEGLELILHRWACAPEEMLFVGDSPHDMAAAAAAGVRFAAFGNPGLRAGIAVASYAELEDRVRSMLAVPPAGGMRAGQTAAC
ncbi:MAG: HAD family hydrolase [Desulfovibrionaceae bacterium]|nr:HAD-IA family hydrolase [Desulfovibrionaceae bacterium]